MERRRRAHCFASLIHDVASGQRAGTRRGPGATQALRPQARRRRLPGQARRVRPDPRRLPARLRARRARGLARDVLGGGAPRRRPTRAVHPGSPHPRRTPEQGARGPPAHEDRRVPLVPRPGQDRRARRGGTTAPHAGHHLGHHRPQAGARRPARERAALPRPLRQEPDDRHARRHVSLPRVAV